MPTRNLFASIGFPCHFELVIIHTNVASHCVVVAVAVTHSTCVN